MNKLTDITVPADLEGCILLKIHRIEKRDALVRCTGTSVLAAASCVGTVFAVVYVVHSMDASGFPQFMSLAFSDSSALITYWKEFSMSIVETLPFFGVTASFVLVGIFIWSLSKTTKNAKVYMTA